MLFRLLSSNQLAEALKEAENQLLIHPQPQLQERLQDLQTDYQLMVDYWKKGFNDPQRDKLYRRLLRSLYNLAHDIRREDEIQRNPLLAHLRRRFPVTDGEDVWREVRQRLETFSTDAALLELEPPHTREIKQEALARDHQQYIDQLFGSLAVSGHWRGETARIAEQVVLSPTVDLADRLLLVSGLMLSLMRGFCIGKWLVLVHVYQQAIEEPLRQRALVGWVLGLDAAAAPLFPEMREALTALCSSKHTVNELIELQYQMVYCLDAEADSRVIQNEIMPDLMRGSGLRFTRGGLEEKGDESSLEEIINPEREESAVEQMENRMRQMADMHREGVDIYFAGFAQMKRHPFFNDLSNWFVPFLPTHPAVMRIWNNPHGQQFLHQIVTKGAFCDSDRYSFVIAFNQVLDHIPAQMLRMIEQGEAVPLAAAGEWSDEEMRSATYVRRSYLQDLFRFFRLHPQRSLFANPFDEKHPACFFTANPIFNGTPLCHRCTDVAAFLIKRKRLNEAAAVLQNEPDGADDYVFHMQMGWLARHLHHDLDAAFAHYHYACLQSKFAPKCRKALARVEFEQGQYDDALENYEALLEDQPGNHTCLLHKAVCLARLDRREEALQLLFRLSYEQQDDNEVTRVLAYTLTADGKYEQAMKLYGPLVEAHPTADDWLNYGYCLWFARHTAHAIAAFRNYLKADKQGQANLADVLRRTDHHFILAHGITETEIMLMLGAV